MFLLFFFFNDTATTEIYTLSLHDALPIYDVEATPARARLREQRPQERRHEAELFEFQSLPRDRRVGLQGRDRKSTRLNSSHANISYAVFCLKKKNKY